MHGYKSFQQWNQWLTQHELGESLIRAEKELLSGLLQSHFGKHALLIGVPQQNELLSATRIPCHSMLGPLLNKENVGAYIEGDLHELPVLTGGVDLVMLPHTLEFVDNPRQLLAEACRIIKPEGLIVICGFNPLSAWGIQKKLFQKKAPWQGDFIHAHQIKNWLRLAEFDVERQSSTLFRPPVAHPKLYQKLHILEKVGQLFPVLGGVYIILARAKVIPLTPIRMKWKQRLDGIRISTTISGHIARQSKNRAT